MGFPAHGKLKYGSAGERRFANRYLQLYRSYMQHLEAERTACSGKSDLTSGKKTNIIFAYRTSETADIGKEIKQIFKRYKNEKLNT